MTLSIFLTLWVGGCWFSFAREAQPTLARYRRGLQLTALLLLSFSIALFLVLEAQLSPFATSLPAQAVVRRYLRFYPFVLSAGAFACGFFGAGLTRGLVFSTATLTTITWFVAAAR